MVDEKEEVIHLGLYNIHNRCNGGLESALRRLDQSNMDLVILQEIKLTKGCLYTGVGRFL